FAKNLLVDLGTANRLSGRRHTLDLPLALAGDGAGTTGQDLPVRELTQHSHGTKVLHRAP
ncbi:MAG: hypothetical protein KC442_13300, partial [Thermomicrobiales bacterium]|nr:hypothetical protein [Thermomicrobiales bacterium]